MRRAAACAVRAERRCRSAAFLLPRVMPSRGAQHDAVINMRNDARRAVPTPFAARDDQYRINRRLCHRSQRYEGAL